MSYEFYVYYRVDPAATGELRRCVDLVQQDIARQTGVQGRLLVRADEPLMWMELYVGIADRQAFARTLDAALSRHGAYSLVRQECRTTEVFTAITG